MRRSIALLILLALLLASAPSFSRPVEASEYDVTWRSWVDVNGNGQPDPLEFQGDFSIRYSAPDSAEPSSLISVDLTIKYVDNEFSRAHKHTFKEIVVSLRETPGGADIMSAPSSYSTIILDKGESISDTINIATPSEAGVYYVVLTFRHEVVGGGIVKGTYYTIVDTGKWSPEDCPTLENKFSSELSLSVSETSVACGEPVVLSGALSPGRSTYVSIELSADGGSTWRTLATVTTEQDGHYSYEWAPTEAGAYSLRARWPGDDLYASAISQTVELTVKVLTKISCELSSGTIAHVFSHGTVTVYGEITPAVPGATVRIYYRTGGGEWSELASVSTDEDGRYSCPWLPPSVGEYEVRAVWFGDAEHERAESTTASLVVVDYTLLTVVVILMAIGAAAGALSVHLLKPKGERARRPSPALTCPYCGAPVPLGAEYCPSCGRELK